MPDFIKRVNFLSPLFNPAETLDIECNVLLDSYSTYIALKKDNTYLGLQVFDHKAKKNTSFSEADIKNFEWLFYKYKKITLLCASQKETLIPSSSFDQNNKELFIKFNFQNIDNDVILYDNIPCLDITNLFTINQLLFNNINSLIPNATIKNQKSVLIEKFHLHNGKLQNIYINTRQDCFDLLTFNEKGLVFCNTFYYSSAQDFIYYLMNVVKLLALDAETINLFLSGEIEKESAVYHFIYKYIRNINFIQKPSELKWPLEDVPYHYFFNTLF